MYLVGKQCCLMCIGEAAKGKTDLYECGTVVKVTDSMVHVEHEDGRILWFRLYPDGVLRQVVKRGYAKYMLFQSKDDAEIYKGRWAALNYIRNTMNYHSDVLNRLSYRDLTFIETILRGAE